MVQESPFHLDHLATSSYLSLWGRTPFEPVGRGLARKTVPRAGRRHRLGAEGPSDGLGHRGRMVPPVSPRTLAVQESPFHFDPLATSSCLSLWGRTPFEPVGRGLARKTVPRAGRGHRLGAEGPSDGLGHRGGQGSRSRWPLALRAVSPSVSLTAQAWGGGVTSLMCPNSPGCV